MLGIKNHGMGVIDDYHRSTKINYFPMLFPFNQCYFVSIKSMLESCKCNFSFHKKKLLHISSRVVWLFNSLRPWIKLSHNYYSQLVVNLSCGFSQIIPIQGDLESFKVSYKLTIIGKKNIRTILVFYTFMTPPQDHKLRYVTMTHDIYHIYQSKRGHAIIFC